MRLLLKVLLRYKHYFPLLGCSLLAVIGFSIASQMEICSLGVVVQTGPDAFVLFGEKRDQRLQRNASISKQQMLERWDEIVKDGEALTAHDANAYIASHQGNATLTKKLANYVSQRIDLSRLQYLALFLICIALLKSVTLFFQKFLSQLVAIRVSCSLRKDYFSALQKLPMEFFHAHDIGNLSNRVVTDSAHISQAINSLMINYIQAPLTTLLALGICISISWKFSLLLCFTFPVLILPIVTIAKKIKVLAKRIQTNQDGFTAVLLDFLSGILTVKVFRTEIFSLSKYSQQNEKIARLEEKSAALALIPRPLLHTIASLFFAFVIVIGLHSFRIPPEELLVFCGLLYLIYEPIKKFADENANIMKGCAAAERFYEIVAHPLLEDTSEGRQHFKGLQQELEFRDVSFCYSQRSEPVLRQLSFSMRKGEALGIVGPTGSGKSTITKLLSRLYEPSQGDILFDSVPIKDLSKDSLREHIGCVLQNPFLFHDTVWNNLACGRQVSEEQIIRALQQAHAYDFVQELPDGIHTMLEESGKNLSGGQQQRLVIARALLKNAPILILDEATSALDAISENYIKDVIGRLKGHCTQIIIAHRLSTLEHVDRVIYLEQGRKIAEGTKEHLLQTCPSFLKMWTLNSVYQKSSSHVSETLISV